MTHLAKNAEILLPWVRISYVYHMTHLAKNTEILLPWVDQDLLCLSHDAFSKKHRDPVAVGQDLICLLHDAFSKTRRDPVAVGQDPYVYYMTHLAKNVEILLPWVRIHMFIT